jgi:hypothetical protein
MSRTYNSGEIKDFVSELERRHIPILCSGLFIISAAPSHSTIFSILTSAFSTLSGACVLKVSVQRTAGDVRARSDNKADENGMKTKTRYILEHNTARHNARNTEPRVEHVY